MKRWNPVIILECYSEMTIAFFIWGKVLPFLLAGNYYSADLFEWEWCFWEERKNPRIQSQKLVYSQFGGTIKRFLLKIYKMYVFEWEHGKKLFLDLHVQSLALNVPLSYLASSIHHLTSRFPGLSFSLLSPRKSIMKKKPQSPT